MILQGGIIGGGTFPTVMGQATSHDNTVGGSIVATLPSGIVAGELLLIFHAGLNSPTASGWTQALAGSSNGVLWKIASGSEGASVTLTAGSGTSQGASVAYRIAGGSSVEASTLATGVSTSPDSPSLSPTWGKKQTLWFAGAGIIRTGSGGTVSVSAYPSGFSNPQTDIGISSFPQGVRVAVAEKQERIATQNPGAFTISVSTNWSAYTVAVRR